MVENKKKIKDFWNDHSLVFLEMAMKREYQETVVQYDGYGSKKRSCGDTIKIFLQIKDNLIDAVSYDIKGCLFSHACANALIELTAGLSVGQARQVSADQIISYLETLPEAEAHCADLALAAFNMALDDYQQKES